MSANPIFELWGAHDRFVFVRIDVECQAYDRFRSTGRNLMRHLLAREEEAAGTLLDCIHDILGEVATAPIDLGSRLSDRVSAIGGGSVRMRIQWGPDCARAHQEFIDSALAICSEKSALRNAVEQTLIEELDSDLRFYCHRSAAEAFISIGATPEQALLTPDSYRKARPFEILLKAGPIRSIGFGRMPESLIAAPRFSRLRQIAWASEKNEPGFAESHMEPLGFDIASHWDRREEIFKCGHRHCTSKPRASDEDEAWFDDQIRTRINRVRGATVRGTILRLSGSKMLAQRPGSEIVTYVPAIDRVLLKEAEDVAEGDVILRHEHFSLDLGPVATSDEPIVREWRAALRHRHTQNTPLLLRELKRQGVSLVRLASAVRAWMSNQRPQQETHFEIVSRVIGWDARRARQVWRVFSEQHGAAVQHGLIGAALASEAVVSSLNKQSLESLREYAARPELASLRIAVEVAETTLEVRGYVVDEIETSNQLSERSLDEIVEVRKDFS